MTNKEFILFLSLIFSFQTLFGYFLIKHMDISFRGYNEVLKEIYREIFKIKEKQNL